MVQNGSCWVLQVLCGWLEEAIGRSEAAALFLPLFFLVRGRLPEALAWHARLLRSAIPNSLQGAHGLCRPPQAPEQKTSSQEKKTRKKKK